MKLTTKLNLALALAAAMFTTSAIAGPGGRTPGDLPQRISTKEEAKECCKAGAKVALACKDCKTVQMGANEKGILGWFKADSTHGCSGCGGKITVQGSGEKKGATAQYKHVCTKCGPDSAYVCTDHKKS